MSGRYKNRKEGYGKREEILRWAGLIEHMGIGRGHSQDWELGRRQEQNAVAHVIMEAGKTAHLGKCLLCKHGGPKLDI